MRRDSDLAAPNASRRTPKGCARWSGILLVSHPLLQRAATKWESVAMEQSMQAHSSSPAAPASSAATSRTGCCATASVEAVTLYDNFSSGREWHYAHHEHDPPAARDPRRREGSAPRSSAPWPATTS